MSDPPPLVCDVCGSPGITVCSSGMGAISLCYCAECLAAGYEPYFAMVGGLCPLDSWEQIHPSYHATIMASLEKAGKTDVQLFADIRQLAEDFDKAMSQKPPESLDEP